MIRPHEAQLLVCHERIAADAAVHETRDPQATQFCQLGAHAWCFDCGHYVCDIHTASRHEGHDLQTVEAEQAEAPAVDVEHGDYP